MKPSRIEYEMKDGSKVELSMNMAGIYELKQRDKEMYEVVNNVLMNGAKEITDILDVLYAAFVIANPEKKMTKIEFLENANTAFIYNATTVNGMITRKKK